MHQTELLCSKDKKEADGSVSFFILCCFSVVKMVKKYAEAVGLSMQDGFADHFLCLTAATTAREHETDIAKVQG